MVNNHGDRKSPKWGKLLFQMAFSWLINRGDPNHLLNGTILQVDITSWKGFEVGGNMFL